MFPTSWKLCVEGSALRSLGSVRTVRVAGTPNRVFRLHGRTLSVCEFTTLICENIWYRNQRKNCGAR